MNNDNGIKKLEDQLAQMTHLRKELEKYKNKLQKLQVDLKLKTSMTK